MRRTALLALTCLLAPLAPAMAQHWNDASPGRDLLGSTMRDFDNFRQRLPPPSLPEAPGIPGMAMPSRQPIPMLDWVPPPVAVPAPAPRRTAAPPPASARPSEEEIERTLAARERELDRLRRQLEADRARYQQGRQPPG